MASITGTSVSMKTSLKFSTTQATSSKFSNLRSVLLPISKRGFPFLRLRKGASRFNVSCSTKPQHPIALESPFRYTAKPETVDKVCTIVRKQLALAPETVVNGESKFVSLGADSLDTVEIVMGLEEEFGISVEEETAQSIITVQDAADLIENLIEKKA